MNSETNCPQRSQRTLAHDNDAVTCAAARLHSRLGSAARSFQSPAHTDRLDLEEVANAQYGKPVISEVVMQETKATVLANHI